MKKPESQLQELVTRLQQACGENLVSIVLYGSAAREDFHEQFSDVNVLVVLQHLDAASFAAISAVLRWWSHEQKLRPPLIMTLEELRESADVFAIELLDIQRSHKTLFGQDVVTAIPIPMNLHRVEVEHELRTTLLRLRHHLLLSPDNQDELRAVLAKSHHICADAVPPCLDRAGNGTPPEAKPRLLEKAGEVLDSTCSRCGPSWRCGRRAFARRTMTVPCLHGAIRRAVHRIGCACAQAPPPESAVAISHLARKIGGERLA